MPCSPGLWWSSGHCCLLGLTLLLLVCEVITSRLCNSLIIMVDSFHTLFIFLHLSFLYLPPRQPPTMPPLNPLSSTPTPPNGTSPNTPVSLSPASLMTPTPVSPLYPSAPASAPSPPSSPILRTPSSLSCPYGWARVQPLGALVSALLLASLCVSVSVDIISQILWPHPTEHPLLVTAAGVVGLLFNTAFLTMGPRGLVGLKGGFTCPVVPRMGTSFSGPDGKGEAEVGESGALEQDKDQACAHSSSTSLGRNLQDDALMFCNPGASSVLDPDQQSKGNPPPPPGIILTGRTFVNWAHPKTGFQNSRNLGKPYCGSCCHSKPHSGAPEDGGCAELGDADAGIKVCLGVPVGTERPILSRRYHCLPGLITLVQALLGPVLVLASGLVLLHSDPGCMHSVGGCDPLVYLDPGFSALAALVFLAAALPQACRHGYLLLLGTPPHFSLGELSRRIAGVPGVLAVHELHVWQLTEVHLVASVHVHCHPGPEAQACPDLLAGVTEVLRDAGVRHSTVQPEFLPVGLASAASSLSTGNPPLPAGPHCSLACRTQCAQKMCCSPREQGPRMLPSADQLEDVQSQALIIENTYL
ncbi:proton-coupled zinc antiporter SLC30A1 isoform X2 [Anguilla rostrata]